MLESVRGKPGPESALSFKYNLGSVCRRLYFYTREDINVDCDNARSFTRDGTVSAHETADWMRRVRMTRSARMTGGSRAAASLAPRPSPSPPHPSAGTTRPPPCSMHRCSLHMAPKITRENEPRSHTHECFELHKCNARCDSLTPRRYCQL